MTKAEAAAVTSIGTAFQNCQMKHFMEFVNFVNNTNIQGSAFSGSKLKRFIVPSFVDDCSVNAFNDCRSLSFLRFECRVISGSGEAVNTATLKVEVGEQLESFSYYLACMTFVNCNEIKFFPNRFPSLKVTGYQGFFGRNNWMSYIGRNAPSPKTCYIPQNGEGYEQSEFLVIRTWEFTISATL